MQIVLNKKIQNQTHFNNHCDLKNEYFAASKQLVFMKVCIAEKPSVAREIAAVLGANTKHDGYFEGNGYAVTYTFGHLCTLFEPND
jgi:hypothetical protein